MGLIYVDACLLIYALEDHPRFGARVRERFAAAPANGLAISPLVQLQCLVGPMKSGNQVLQQHCEEGGSSVGHPRNVPRGRGGPSAIQPRAAPT